MKKIISLVCAVVLLVLCIAPMPAKAAATDTLALSSVFLRTAEGKEGIFFGARFNLSQDTLDNMTCYGLALTTKALADDAWTAEMDKGVLRSSYTSGLKAGATKEVTSTSLVNIINISNDSMTNTRNANTVIYVRPYVQMKDGSFVYGDASSITMKQVAQMVDAAYNNLNDTQKRGLLGMYERFTSCMKGWGLTNIKGNYPNGTDVNGESLILQYRREKVVANMTAQNNVLWSITTEGNQSVQYSRTPSSKGIGTDPADETYTLYPGRVYRGIPYTHGSAGLASFEHLGTKDQYGVVNFSDFHGSYFSGGSTDGSSATTGLYNVARLGNDCWDAVYWAWASAGAHTTADQTLQMTVSYGLKLLGEDILTEAMQGFVAPDGRVMGENGGTIWDFICTKSKDGYYGYRSISNDVTGYTQTFTGYYEKTNSSDWFGLSSGTYTIEQSINGTVDGTALVRYATRDFTGNLSTIATTKTDLEDLRPVCDYQTMYQTYTLAKPGDAMVHFSNTNGHAIMVIEVNPVYNDDGTIDGEKSTIILLEQASGHEKRQSKDKSAFTVTSLSQHNQHDDGSNTDCLYCAGYTGETTEDGREIWKLDYGLQTRTFKTIAESNYLAMTCDVLSDPAAKISASRISDSASDVDINGIYTGTLNSTYRVAHVILDIFDGAGNKVNSSTCFGIQNGNTNPFVLNRFSTDATAGEFGSVLKGVLALQQKSHTYTVTNENGETVYTYKSATNGNYYKDAEGNYIEITEENPAPEGTTTFYNKVEKTATAKWLEAPTLDAGSYSYTMTCVLSNGYTKTFRTGYFTVAEGVNFLGETAMLVSAD